MTKNIFIPIEKETLTLVKYWKSTKRDNVIRGSFNYDHYKKYQKAINDKSFIVQNPK